MRKIAAFLTATLAYIMTAIVLGFSYFVGYYIDWSINEAFMGGSTPPTAIVSISATFAAYSLAVSVLFLQLAP